jgi:hypothetical protein
MAVDDRWMAVTTDFWQLGSLGVPFTFPRSSLTLLAMTLLWLLD